jgi:cation channel sperm-associated protein 1
MFAVIGRGLYAELDEEHFGSLFQSLFTLFQLLTLDDWFDIYTTISEKGIYSWKT